MNMLRIALALTCTTMAVAACAPRPADTSADEAQIKADPAEWFDAYNAGNADAIANLYTEDGVLLPPGASARQGKAAILEFVTGMIAQTSPAGQKMQFGEVTGVGISGDLAWLSGTFAVNDASGMAVDKGKFLSVYRKENGNWQMVRDIWNSDMPPAAPSPAPMEGAATGTTAAPTESPPASP
jgi:uncharacterized protein (TIGR02246 family)